MRAEPSPEDKVNADKHYEQGKAYYRTRNFAQAVTSFERSYDLDPQPKVLFNLGRCYEELGDRQNAVEYYRRYIDTGATRGTEEARARIAALEREIAAADAERAARENAALRQQKAQELREKGDAAGRNKQYGEAITRYREAYELGRDAEVLFAIAEAYRKQGDRPKAIVEYEKYREAAPAGENNALALQYKASLEAAIENEIAEKAERERRARQPGADDLPSGRKLKIAGLATAGAGGLTLAIGVFFGLRAQTLEGEVESFDGSWTVELDQKVADGESAARIATVSYIVGGAALVGGGVLYGVGYWRDRKRRKAAQHSQITLVPSVTPSGATVFVMGTF